MGNLIDGVVVTPSIDPSIRTELRELLVLAAPIALAQVLLIGISLMDTSVLGHVSVDSLAGASIGRSIGFASLCLGMGVSMGLEPVASQALGAGETERAWLAYVVNLRAGLLVWLPSLLMALAVTLVLPPLGLEPVVVDRARMFILGQAPGMALMVAFLTTKTFLQANGVTAPAFAAACIANVTNFIVCNLLVRGDDALRAVHLPGIGLPRLDAFGGGLAFSLSEGVLFGVGIWFARKLRPDSVGTDASVTVRAAWRLGVPIGLQMLAEVGLFTTASLLTGRFGARVLAAHQIALGLATFTYMGALGISGATAVRVGLAVGAGRPARRAGLIGIALGAGIMMVPAVVFWTIPEVLVGLFTGDPEVIALGVQLLHIAALFQLFDGVQAVATGALRGAGDVRFPFIANVLAHWFFGLPSALLFGFVLGAQARGIWWGLTAGLVAISIALFSRFFYISRGVISRV